MVSSYRDLTVWKRAMELVEIIYQLTMKLPSVEKYGLASQVQRAAVSLPSNIAEGHARESTREYLRYLLIVRGSLAELETQLLLCERLKLLTADDIAPAMAICDELGRMLRGLQHSLNDKLNAQDH
ncbi:MAG: four helix bundle protein [Burkholderiales bacterium]